MRRFTSLDGQPQETRKILVDRFERDLRDHTERYVPSPPDHRLDPALALEVLSDLILTRPRTVAAARAAVDTAVAHNPSVASFDELLQRQLVRVVWGEVELPFGTRYAADWPPREIAEALRAILALPNAIVVELGPRGTEALRCSADPLAAYVLNAPPERREDAVQAWAAHAHAPGWISAQLWQRAPSDDKVRWWFDRNALLERGHHHVGVPDEHWARPAQVELCDEILKVLETEPDIVGWEHERELLLRGINFQRMNTEPPAADRLPVPAELLGRLEWLEDAERAHHAVGFRDREALFALVGYLIRSVSRDGSIAAPHPVVRRLVGLAVDRPALWFAIEWQLARFPATLADLLMCKPSVPWALGWIARCVPQMGSAWDREAVQEDAKRRRTNAFGDAIEVGLHCLLGRPGEGALDAGPAIAWCLFQLHGLDTIDGRGVARVTDPERTQFWSALSIEAAERPEVARVALGEAVAYASHRIQATTFGSTWTRVLLDLVARGSTFMAAEAVTAALSAVALRYGAFMSQTERFEADPLPEMLAATFVAGVLETPAIPFDLAPIGVLASEALAAGDDFDRRRAARVKGRTHLRLLARAAAGWVADTVPERLIDAISAILGISVGNDMSRGSLGAFTAEEEVSFALRTPPLANDVGRALLRVSPPRHAPLVRQLAGVTEPLALASFARVLHGDARTQIVQAAEHAVAAPPDVLTLREVQARVDFLLAAELYAEAEKLFNEQRAFETLGRVPGRQSWHFRVQLWLDLAARRYDRIRATTVPPDLASGIGTEDAHRTLTFFQALAEMEREGGSMQAAEQAFARLHQRFPEVSAYAVNLHAARLRLVLPNGDGAPLSNTVRAELSALLARGDLLMARYRDALAASGDDTYEANRAIIRLALGQNEGVLQDLDDWPALARGSERLLSCRVTALRHLGRVAEARATLEAGVEVFGRTERLAQLSVELAGSAAQLPPVEVERVEHRVSRIRAAIAELPLLAPHEQAQVFGATSLHRLIVRRVRDACTGIVDLVPFLKGGAESPPLEEAINEFFRRILMPTVSAFGWACPGEDPGGHTPKKWGSRDTTIAKDGRTIAIIEALSVRKATVSAGEAIREHALKALGYSAACNLRFIIVWSFDEDPNETLRLTRESAAALAPPHPLVSGPRDLQRNQGDSGHPGFIMVYQAFSGEIHLVYLVVDLVQRDARSAAGQP